MKTTSIIFKPVLWRLIVYNGMFVLIGMSIAVVIINWSFFSFDPAAYGFTNVMSASFLGALSGMIIGILLTPRRYDVEISKGKISGPGAGIITIRNVFLISELERSSLDKQSFMDKLSGRRVLCSTRGEKIAFTPFFYGNASYEILCQHLEQEYNS